MKTTEKTAPQNEAPKGTEAPKQEASKKPAWIQQRKIRNSDFKDVPKRGSILISGNILSFEGDTGDYGDYTIFKGDFMAKFTLPEIKAEPATDDLPAVVGRPAKEVILRATKLFLPPVAEEILNNHVASFLEKNDVSEIKKIGGLTFALRLVKTPDSDPKNAKGWVWNVTPIGKAESSSDRVLALLESSAKAE